MALVSGGGVRYILEVMHTHATGQAHASYCPEPWFEIAIDNLPDSDRTNISIICGRTDQNRFCADRQLRAQSPYGTRRDGKEFNDEEVDEFDDDELGSCMRHFVRAPEYPGHEVQY